MTICANMYPILVIPTAGDEMYYQNWRNTNSTIAKNTRPMQVSEKSKRKLEMVDMVEQGYTIEEIAEAWGISKAAVYKRASRYNIRLIN